MATALSPSDIRLWWCSTTATHEISIPAAQFSVQGQVNRLAQAVRDLQTPKAWANDYSYMVAIPSAYWSDALYDVPGDVGWVVVRANTYVLAFPGQVQDQFQYGSPITLASGDVIRSGGGFIMSAGGQAYHSTNYRDTAGNVSTKKGEKSFLIKASAGITVEDVASDGSLVVAANQVGFSGPAQVLN